ncbi:saccharopine dehydrogenase NADP-binding domain-containing protein [Streptomyces sp. NPDC101249]|uniref:saccharopine dehydrogenase NADP-binding domain-containing protein n=1 Tax=Streptomyces sp. NPDC101249 TaxID=3366140 RepID=UPI00380F329D
MTTAKIPGAGPAGRILVVGGHGAVGTVVVRALDAWFPGRVLPAGRDAARARRTGGVRVDVGDPDGFRRLLDRGGVALVVLCVEPPDATVARLCLERGVGLVDVGATARLLDGVAALDGTARRAGAPAVLSVGVAPGLTNLLARRVHEAVGGADRVDLTLLLGAGERHGADALRWTVEGLATPVPGRPARVGLPDHGTRTAHPFPFSDQYTLPGTLGVPDVTTRLCLDSRPLTAALFALRRGGRARPAARPGVRRLLRDVMGRVHVGGDAFAVRADAWRGERHAGLVLGGRAQSRVTGLVAAHVARAVLDGAVPAGVRHIEEVAALTGLPDRLAAEGAVSLRTVTSGAPRQAGSAR